MLGENLHVGGKWETMNFLGVALLTVQFLVYDIQYRSNTW